MKSAFLLTCAATVCLLGASQPAFAQGAPRTIQITIPVKLTNFGGPQAMVWCELRDGSNHGVAASFKHIAVANGSANLSVTLPVSFMASQEANIAGWRCVVTAPTTDDDRNRNGNGQAKYTAIPNLQVFGEITGKF